MKKLPTNDDIREIIEQSLRPKWRIGIVYSSFYKEEIDQMVRGAVETLREVGISKEQISFHPVPGSFEIPLIGSALAKEQSIDALIGLGIIVEGQTHHAHLIADNVARGIMDVQTRYLVPFAFEVLYVDSLERARERLTKGKEAAISVVHSLAHLNKLQS